MKAGQRGWWILVVAAVVQVAGLGQRAWAEVLEVGPGKAFEKIEAAYERAAAGDEILVHPKPGNAAYERVAVRVRKPGLKIRGKVGADGALVKVDGTGFEYSGAGSVPRAIFQFNEGGDGGLLEGFELTGAHNASHNGAGVRISSANDVTVRNCRIHGNDMGIMSGGDGVPGKAANQRVEYCEIHHNGALDDPGYNHNLYLGGTSVMVRFCDIHHSLTGHNFKSRAQVNWVEYCHIHDAANREVDLVDAVDTEREDSDSVLVGNLIVKDPEARGNRGVIHFGQDGGKDHRGTLFLIHNTIVTPYVTPVVDLSAPGTAALLMGNLVSDGGVKQNGQQAAAARNGAMLERVTGRHNLFGRGFAGAEGTGLSARENGFRFGEGELFQNAAAGDYRPKPPYVGNPDLGALKLPAFPGAKEAPEKLLQWQYQAPVGRLRRSDGQAPVVGAFSVSE